MIKAAPVLKGLSLLLALLLLACLWSSASKGAPAGAAAQPEQRIAQEEGTPLKLVPWKGKPGSTWKAYDKAVSEQKYERAYEIAEGNLKAARS